MSNMAKKKVEVEETKVKEEVKEEATPKLVFIASDVVRLQDTTECPKGFMTITVDESMMSSELEKMHVKVGDNIFIPTEEELRRRGR